MLLLKALNDKRLIEVLQKGKVGIIPTDTVYGLVCLANNEAAVKRLYALKSREFKPGTIIASNVDQFVQLGIPRRYLSAVEHFWPNPISIETPHDITYLHQGTGRQALRIPKDDEMLWLLERVGPLQTTSANLPGEKVAYTIGQAIEYFGDQVDFYVDGGDLSNRKPSTIIAIRDDAIELVREGAVKINERGEIV